MNKTTEPKAKPTAGPGPFIISEHKKEPYYFIHDANGTSVMAFNKNRTSLEAVQMFADTLTIFNETGLTPRQMVERIKELEKAIDEFFKNKTTE